MKKLIITILAMVLALTACKAADTPPDDSTSSNEHIPTPTEAAATLNLPETPEGTVYVTVAVGGEIKLAAQPVVPNEMTVEGAMIAAHNAYYEGGAEAGFTTGTAPDFGDIYVVERFWGVDTMTLHFVNGEFQIASADIQEIKTGDNIVVSDGSMPYSAIKVFDANGKVQLSVTRWDISLTTFAFELSPFSGAEVTDVATNAILGVTDDNGNALIDIPNGYVVTVGGCTAVNIAAALGRIENIEPIPELPTKFADLSIEMPPLELPETPEGTVYVTVVMNGDIVLTAQPVTPELMTLEGVYIAVHDTYYEGGADSGFEMNGNMASRFWGIKVGAMMNCINDGTAKKYPPRQEIETGDNITLTNRDPQVSLTVTEVDGRVQITALEWYADWSIPGMKSRAFINVHIVDPETGTLIGITDTYGNAIVDVPEGYVISVGGVAAINVAAALGRADNEF